MKYLIIGTGGIGGAVAGFLASAGKDVTVIARGAHLAAFKEKGLCLKSGIKGDICIRISKPAPLRITTIPPMLHLSV